MLDLVVSAFKILGFFFEFVFPVADAIAGGTSSLIRWMRHRKENSEEKRLAAWMSKAK